MAGQELAPLPTAAALPVSRALADMLELAAAARTYADAGQAPATRRAYAADLRHFSRWCDAAGTRAMPASAAAVAMYLTAYAATLTVATLDRRLAAIRSAHKRSGHPAPDSGDLDEIWSGIRRTHGRPPRKKRALVTADLKRAVDATPASGPRGLRDRAILLLGFASALRRSELAALTLEGAGCGDVVMIERSGGLEIVVGRSKGDQEGRGRSVGVPYGKTRHCAVSAVRAWLAAAAIRSGPVFRPVTRWGVVGDTPITPAAIADVVKDAAERVGLDPAVFGGHSLRSGLITSAAAKGAKIETLRDHARHADIQTTVGYVQAGELLGPANAARKAGL